MRFLLPTTCKERAILAVFRLKFSRRQNKKKTTETLKLQKPTVEKRSSEKEVKA